MSQQDKLNNLDKEFCETLDRLLALYLHRIIEENKQNKLEKGKLEG